MSTNLQTRLAVAWSVFSASIVGGVEAAQIGPRSRPAAADTGVLAGIPGDPAAVRGTLPNGLRFIVRRNLSPAHRAELRLVVNAGSVLEDDDQQGLAHFIEHMAFRGTARFARSAVTDYLASVGARLGPDLNAETGPDQTVYRMTVPTDQAGVLAQGIAILAQWAQAVTFDSAEMVAERGVVLAEWRLRTGGGTDPSLRLRERTDSLLYAGTRYPERAPIGSPAVIEAATPASLRRFYDDWYRPDLMTVVVVGDFDRQAVVRLIRTQFGGLKNPSPERPRPAPGFPAWHGPLVGTGISGAGLILLFRQPVDSADTAAAGWLDVATRHALLRNMLANILSRRFLSSNSAGIPVWGSSHPTASWQGCSLYGGADRCLVLASAVPADAIRRGLAALATDLAEIAQHGPSADELDWARRRISSDWANEDLRDATRPSEQWVEEYLGSTFGPAPYRAPNLYEQRSRVLLPTLRPSDVAAFVRACCTLANLAVIVDVPSAGGPGVPGETSLSELLDSVQHATIPVHTEPSALAQVLVVPPATGRIVAERAYPNVGVTEWTLSNGMRVVFKPTTFAGDELYLRALAPGGSSIAPDSLWPAAAVATDVVSELGWGDFTPEALRQRLFGDFLAGPPAVRISPGEARIDVEGSPQHAELLFQLVHLAFLAPRPDSAAFAAWQSSALAFSPAREQLHRQTPSDILTELLVDGDPRGRDPTPAQLDRVRVEQVTQFYQARFGDASHFTVVVVGGLTAGEARPLVERYLASLPTRHEGPEHVGHVPVIHLAQAAHQTRRVLGGDVALTMLAFYGSLRPWTAASENELKAVLNVVQHVLNVELRDRRGAVYAVDVRLAEPPQGADTTYYVAQIRFMSAPEQSAGLAQVAEDLIRNIQRGHVPAVVAENVAVEMSQYSQTAFTQNRPWLERLTMRLERGWPIGEPPTLNVHLTPQRVAAAARKYLDFQRYVQLTLLPKDEQAAPSGR